MLQFNSKCKLFCYMEERMSGLAQHEVEQIMREFSFLCELFHKVCTISCWKWDFHTSWQSYCSCIKKWKQYPDRNTTKISTLTEPQDVESVWGMVRQSSAAYFWWFVDYRGRVLPVAQLSTGSQSRERMLCRWFLPDPHAQIWQPEKEAEGNRDRRIKIKKLPLVA